MEKRKCPVLVNGKECGHALTLVERELETATAVYECPLGHRTQVLLGELGQRKCRALVNGKECGLALTLVERELETATAVYECPLGHRTYVPLEPEAADSS
jgi:hypothetical protein